MADTIQVENITGNPLIPEGILNKLHPAVAKKLIEMSDEHFFDVNSYLEISSYKHNNPEKEYEKTRSAVWLYALITIFPSLASHDLVRKVLDNLQRRINYELYMSGEVCGLSEEDRKELEKITAARYMDMYLNNTVAADELMNSFMEINRFNSLLSDFLCRIVYYYYFQKDDLKKILSPDYYLLSDHPSRVPGRINSNVSG